MAKFLVMRKHIGDQDYFEGDIREANPADVTHLVASGVLVAEIDSPVVLQQAKAEPSQLNKSEPAPQNKSAKSTSVK